MASQVIDVALIGAGPYGLSIAAHLHERKVAFRIFGSPMSSWRNHMPGGTFLKSDGFASSLYDPGSVFTLAHYCHERGLPYSDVGLPVPIETFVGYGLEFQRRFVPDLEQTDIVSLERIKTGFALVTQAGETIEARRVVVAAGITHFAYTPPIFEDLPPELRTHSSEQTNVTPFRGRSVAVIGAGASAVDLAGLLHEAGADVQLIARRDAITFHEPSTEPRPVAQRLLQPRSGLGLGWKSRLCTDVPLVFHALPERLRIRAVQRHLGPAPGWFAKSKFVGHVATHLGTKMMEAVPRGGGVQLRFSNHASVPKELHVDHVITATGYKVKIDRLKFFEQNLRDQIKTVDGTPVLGTNFQCSVPGLYLVGLASSNSFGPLCRFAFGAKFTSKRISRHLATTA